MQTAFLVSFAGAMGCNSSASRPLPTVAAATALVVEIMGSLALLAGYSTRVAALVLAAFTLLAGFFFHAY